MLALITAMTLGPTFALHDDDRIVFYGDSITEQRNYTTFAEAFIRARYPHLDASFFARGWAGDASWGGGGGTIEERIAKDVKPLRPTVIVVMLGMNDGGYVPAEPKIEDAIRRWYPKLIDELRSAAPAAHLTLIETSPWDQFAHTLPPGPPKDGDWAPWDGYNEVLVHYADIIRENATRVHATFVDFNSPLKATLKQAKAIDPKLAQEIIPDSIHPAPAACLVMAARLFEAWGGEPVVSNLVLDAGTHALTMQNGTAKLTGPLEWEQTDSSLPLPIEITDPVIRLAWVASGSDDAVNRQIVQVAHLEPGTYSLEVDGKAVATADAAHWGRGVNIASYDTPMHRQALELLELTRQRSEIDFFRWRRIQREQANRATARAVEVDLDDLECELAAAQRHASVPRGHRLKLVKGTSS